VKKQKFAVVRKMTEAGVRDPVAGGFALGPKISNVESVQPPEIKIDVDELSSRDVRTLAQDPSVAAVARVMPTKLIAPFPETAGAAWGVAAVGATTSSKTGAGVTVAVLDTGIHEAHAAFGGVNLVTKSFVGGAVADAQGHGTHCAGTIFGRDVGGQRIGVARGVTTALIGKVLSDNGSGTSLALFEGMQWAVTNGARVISMSLGFDFPGMVAQLEADGAPVQVATSLALEAYRANLRAFDTIMAFIESQTAFGGGAVVVAATGNESQRPQFEISVSVPAAANDVIAVGALQQAGAAFGVASFSNTLPTVAAPGVQILSAWNDGATRLLSGTSMATPHVAGVAALWWEALQGTPAGTPAGVSARLRATARPGVSASFEKRGNLSRPT
jgi:subtilisin family serine protease